jgi:hypothetical protein
MEYGDLLRKYHLSGNDAALLHARIARGEILCGNLPGNMNNEQYWTELEAQARKMQESRINMEYLRVLELDIFRIF